MTRIIQAGLFLLGSAIVAIVMLNYLSGCGQGGACILI